MLSELRQTWECGDSLAAGELLWGRLPPAHRASWAAAILELAMSRLDEESPALSDCLAIARNAERWPAGHDAFSRLRHVVLSLPADQGPANRRAAWVFAIAELVAKVAYNASDPIDAFDDDSGPWLAKCLRGLVELEDDPHFREAAWAVLELPSGPHK